MSYYEKYLFYKKKYLSLKSQRGGAAAPWGGYEDHTGAHSAAHAGAHSAAHAGAHSAAHDDAHDAHAAAHDDAHDAHAAAHDDAHDAHAAAHDDDVHATARDAAADDAYNRHANSENIKEIIESIRFLVNKDNNIHNQNSAVIDKGADPVYQTINAELSALEQQIQILKTFI